MLFDYLVSTEKLDAISIIVSLHVMCIFFLLFLKGWMKKLKGLSKIQNKKALIDTDNSMVIARRKGSGGGRESKGGIKGDRTLDFGW